MALRGAKALVGEPRESESPLLESHTNSEILAREAAKAKAAKETLAKSATADHPDESIQANTALDAAGNCRAISSASGKLRNTITMEQTKKMFAPPS